MENEIIRDFVTADEHLNYWFGEEVNGYYFFVPRRLLWDSTKLSQEIEDFRMIVIKKYDKNGKSTKIEFARKLAALLWLCDHIDESEWC